MVSVELELEPYALRHEGAGGSTPYPTRKEWGLVLRGINSQEL